MVHFVLRVDECDSLPEVAKVVILAVLDVLVHVCSVQIIVRLK